MISATLSHSSSPDQQLPVDPWHDDGLDDEHAPARLRLINGEGFENDLIVAELRQDHLVPADDERA